MKVRFFLVGALGAILLPVYAFTVAGAIPGYTVGYTSGHEEITRQAMIQARNELAKSGIHPDKLPGMHDLLGDLDPKYLGTKGTQTPNMLIRGNYATDFPEEKDIYHPLNLKNFHGIPGDADWHKYEKSQWIHFLRNYRGEGLESAYATCRLVQKNLIRITREAAKYWEGSLLEERFAKEAIQRGQGAAVAMHFEYARAMQESALYLIGHASHIIQDSFSPAHTRRASRSANNELTDVCYYGRGQHKSVQELQSLSRAERARLESEGESSDGCYHHTIDTRDFIWTRGADQLAHLKSEWDLSRDPGKECGYFYISLGDKSACLKHEARLARTATAKYYYLIAEYINEVRTGKIRDTDHLLLSRWMMDRLFEGPLGVPNLDLEMERGVITCGALVKS